MTELAEMDDLDRIYLDDRRAMDADPNEVHEQMTQQARRREETGQDWADVSGLKVTPLDLPPDDPGQETPPKERGFLDQAGEAIKDVARPITDNPASRVLVGGVFDAVNGLIDTADEIGQLASQKETVSYWGGGKVTQRSEYTKLRLPKIPEGDGMAEQFLRDITQFIAGFGPAGKALQATGKAQNILAGAVADITYDPVEGNLSTFLRELNFDNALTQVLDSKVEMDAEVEKRLRGRLTNAFEGGLTGGVVDTAVAVVKWVKANPGRIADAFKGLVDRAMSASTGGLVKEVPIQFHIMDEGPSAEPRNLVMTHNLTTANLEHAEKMGGLSMPSMAVVKKDNPLQGFGEVILVADPKQFDPSNPAHKFFDADIYSPRYPQVTHHEDYEGTKAAFEGLSDMAMKIQRGLSSSADAPGNPFQGTSKGLDDVIDMHGAPGLRYDFLKEMGKAPRISYQPKTKLPTWLKPFQKKYADHSDIAKKGIRWVLEKDEAFVESAIKNHNEKMDEAIQAFTQEHKGSSEAVLKRRIETLEGRKIEYDPNDFSLGYEHSVRDIVRSAANNLITFNLDKTYGRVVDSTSIQRINSRLESSPKLQEQYKGWVRERYGDLYTEEIFKGFKHDGTRRYVPHTLDNVYKEMRKDDIRGGESLEGPGRTRALVAKQLKSLKAMKDSRGQVKGEGAEGVQTSVDNEEYFELTSAINQSIDKYSGHIGDDLIEDYIKNGWPYVDKEYGVLPNEIKGGVEAFLEKLQGIGTDYFEGKIQRTVKLNEFIGALVPKGAKGNRAAKLLKRQGIKRVHRYDDSSRHSKSKEGALKMLKGFEKFSDKMFSVVPGGAVISQREGNEN